jgi:hypothetical protein
MGFARRFVGAAGSLHLGMRNCLSPLPRACYVQTKVHTHNWYRVLQLPYGVVYLVHMHATL